MSQASFQKRMREKARADKAAAKQQRKIERAAAAAEADDDDEDDGPSVPQEKVIAQLEHLHQQFADDKIDFDEFEERKQELIAQLSV